MRTLTGKSIVSLISAGLLSVAAAGAETSTANRKFYSDDPIWQSPRPVAVVEVANRKLSEYYDFFNNTFFPSGQRAPHSGVYLPSLGINTVDEVPNSAWYTNRHASRQMSLAELTAGPGDSHPPAAGAWTVVAAKYEGITPGFRIRDTAGREYLVKFDPLSNPELASAADVITSKFFYALGYNVPENYVVSFNRAQIVIGTNAQLKDAAGHKRAIRQADIDQMLSHAPRTAAGTYRAMASLLITGKPIGPFKYDGTRSDDPNDLVAHEHRRDLRGLRTFCAWLGHDDSKALNTLDVLTEEDGARFIKHYLIDFGASLGSASFMANSPRDGNVYLFDWKSSAAQFFTLGLYAPKWQHARYPKLPAAGRFEYEIFDPLRWLGDYPNTAFRNENPEDRLWAARKIAAFTEPEIRAIVATGRYTDPRAEEWVARCLIERRKKVVDALLAGTAGLDRFDVRDNHLAMTYVGPGGNPGPIRIQWSTFDNQTGERRILPAATSSDVPALPQNVDYLMAEITAAHGPAVEVYVRSVNERTFVVGVERRFAPEDHLQRASYTHH
jgi:hypothetical protein